MNLSPHLPALMGGMLIGLSATLLLWFNGRVAGISGMLGRLLSRPSAESVWRVLFLLGLIAGAYAFYYRHGGAPVARDDFSAWLLALSGLLVGFGTAMGNGCTSGHGVCGIGLLSVRSLLATCTFVVVAIVVTWMMRHVLGVG